MLRRMKEICQKLEKLMNKNRWNQLDVAEKAGLTQVCISKLIQNKQTPLYDTVLKLAKAFDMEGHKFIDKYSRGNK